jgi:ribonuclease P protein component
MRLRARTDFDELFKSGHVAVDHVLVIHARTATGDGRVGISISKRVGNSPCRNRWKRLIREAYRRLAARSPSVWRLEMVIRPRRGAVPDYAAIERSLASLASRLERQLSRQDRS